LGDILGGMEEQFGLSYIENSLTSNAVLAPLATRDLNDVYLFVDMALGRDVASTDLSHQYSGAEVNEIVDVLKKLFVIRDVVLKVNQQYIISAAQADQYRSEPPFKLQGSYRNMNKMCEKVSAVMNQDELMQLIADHYIGEAQLLTGGAEENLLKLAQLRGDMTDADHARWEEIKANFMRSKAMGGDDTDTGQKVVGQLLDLAGSVQAIAESTSSISREARVQNSLSKHSIDIERKDSDNTHVEQAVVTMLGEIKQAISENQSSVEVINEPVPGIDKLLGVLASTIESSIYPLIRSMHKKLDIDLRTHEKMREVSLQLDQLGEELKSGHLQRSKPRVNIDKSDKSKGN